MSELIGPFVVRDEESERKRSEESIHYATQITIRLGTLIGSEGYPLEEC